MPLLKRSQIYKDNSKLLNPNFILYSVILIIKIIFWTNLSSKASICKDKINRCKFNWKHLIIKYNVLISNVSNTSIKLKKWNKDMKNKNLSTKMELKGYKLDKIVTNSRSKF